MMFIKAVLQVSSWLLMGTLGGLGPNSLSETVLVALGRNPMGLDLNYFNVSSRKEVFLS